MEYNTDIAMICKTAHMHYYLWRKLQAPSHTLLRQ